MKKLMIVISLPLLLAACANGWQGGVPPKDDEVKSCEDHEGLDGVATVVGRRIVMCKDGTNF